MEDSPKSVPQPGRPWTVPVAELNMMKPKSLADDPDHLLEDGDSITRTQLLGSERLRSLMNQPRNLIVALPDERATARFFYCSCCGDIPFPSEFDSPDLNEEGKLAVRLCERGHPMCDDCYSTYGRCPFSMRDYANVFNRPPTVEALNQHTTPGEGDWEQVRLCSKERTTFNCGLLTEMILETEFACSFFYNWCEFRGRGDALRDHEAICKHYKPSSEGEEEETPEDDQVEEASTSPDSGNSVEGSYEDVDEELNEEDGDDEDEDPDETAILNFNLKGTRRRIRKLGRQLKRDFGNNIVIGTIPQDELNDEMLNIDDGEDDDEILNIDDGEDDDEILNIDDGEDDDEIFN